MIEFRTFEGDARELSAFVLGVWRATYEGRMPFPLWSPEFFDWQLLGRPAAERDFSVAAYEGGRLIGVLPAAPYTFRWFGREVLGTQASWMTVAPEYRRRRLGVQLLSESKRRHRERGARCFVGYAYHGRRASIGPAFWKADPHTALPRSLGFWARVIEPRTVARWELSRLEGAGARSLDWWQPHPGRWPPDPHVREYRPNDLPECLALARRLSDGTDVGILWESGSLAHQLAYRGFPLTLVYERDGGVAGFVNYHVLDLLGHGTARTAMIDLMAFGDLPQAAARALLRTALRRMADDGVAVALVLRPCSAWRPLAATLFWPRPVDYHFVICMMTPDEDAGRARRIHVLWR